MFLYERRTMAQVASLQRPGSIRDVVIFDHDLWLHTFDEPPTRVPEVTVSLAQSGVADDLAAADGVPTFGERMRGPDGSSSVDFYASHGSGGRRAMGAVDVGF